MTEPDLHGKSCVVVFGKEPVAGRVKTRLTPPLSPDEAVMIYRAFLADVAVTVARFRDGRAPAAAAILASSGDVEHPAFGPFRDAGFVAIDQGPGDLGDRLRRVAAWCFERGAARVVIVGSDSPTLRVAHLEDAFGALDGHDIVLGPSFDGGYYLIGLKRDCPAVFSNIAWSTDKVLTQTYRRCRQSALLCELLGFWYDVDTLEDLNLLRFHLLDYMQDRGCDIAPNSARVLDELQSRGHFTVASE